MREGEKGKSQQYGRDHVLHKRALLVGVRVPMQKF